EQAAAPGTLDGCTPKTLLKLLTRHVGEVFQARVHLGRTRLQAWICGVVSFAVPGADVLANITPKDVVTSLRTPLLRNRTLEFDRQICNTTLCIQNVGLQNRLRRTCLQEAGARATVVEPRTIVL